MKVPLLDLKKQYKKIEKEVVIAAKEVFESQQFILGPKVEELERKIADYCQCHYAVGVSSGTDALLIALMTAGVGNGDLVITTPYSFFATVGAIVRVGARPIFVDIDEGTYNIDPIRLDATFSALNEVQKSNVKAIIPVHLFGQSADMGPIMEMAETHGITVIEDAAQAIGSEYELSDGKVRRAGAIGQYGCFSFFPSKNLGAFGDGGMVTTNQEEIYERLKIMRVHGSRPKYYHKIIGGNFRLDAIQAAVLIVKLKYLDEWTKERIENANLYRKLFKDAALYDISLPTDREKRHIYNQFVIKAKGKRDELKEFLNGHNIGCEIYYPVPLHMQSCFKYLGYKYDDFPASVEAAESSLALPIYPELTSDQINYVVDMIRKFFDKN
ncbi:MAG: DegT/DnrJ/EryC1/StrS family aminotransferase [Desulfobacteraceae bacterium]|nr:MAG: DegT/DnrJ/EryC1/StrS family aminotransferase [Desulfobacteraceae bacterium]